MQVLLICRLFFFFSISYYGTHGPQLTESIDAEPRTQRAGCEACASLNFDAVADPRTNTPSCSGVSGISLCS